MSRLLRVVLVWIVALALPVQGLAAATMIFCGPGHGQTVAGAHDHSKMAHHHDSDAAQPGDVSKLSHDAEHQAKHKCSACASCCVGIALPSAPFVAPTLDLQEQVFAAPAARASGFVTDGPERPPRAFFA